MSDYENIVGLIVLAHAIKRGTPKRIKMTPTTVANYTSEIQA